MRPWSSIPPNEPSYFILILSSQGYKEKMVLEPDILTKEKIAARITRENGVELIDVVLLVNGVTAEPVSDNITAAEAYRILSSVGRKND